jgi:prepilin peptidase CpaA|uniref:Prepilin peptidase n=1 Tax=Desulfobacca acetoxidans TaxID=60893 RepID=A0A7C3SIU3_9BACT
MNFFEELPGFFNSQGYLLWPLLLALWLAVGDVRTQRIPNYLTLAIALSGFGWQVGVAGWVGAAQSLLGLGLGFGLLIIPYLMGGIGAGDVKALAALGAWLGPWQTFCLFFYMALAGGLLALGVLIWKGQLGAKLRQGWNWLLNWVLRRPFRATEPREFRAIKMETQGIPYGVAIALGMVALYWRGPTL